MVDLVERMLMKVVTVVPIFCGRSRIRKFRVSRAHVQSEIDPDHCDSPIREPFMQPNAATSRSASIRYEGTFSRHAHPLSLSHTELLRMR